MTPRPTISREACSGLAMALLPLAACAALGFWRGLPWMLAAAGALCLMGSLGWIKLPWLRTPVNQKPPKVWG